MKTRKPTKIKYIKETPEARKKRASTGVKFRAVTFNDKRQKLRNKAIELEDKP